MVGGEPQPNEPVTAANASSRYGLGPDHDAMAERVVAMDAGRSDEPAESANLSNASVKSLTMSQLEELGLKRLNLAIRERSPGEKQTTAYAKLQRLSSRSSSTWGSNPGPNHLPPPPLGRLVLQEAAMAWRLETASRAVKQAQARRQLQRQRRQQQRQARTVARRGNALRRQEKRPVSVAERPGRGGTGSHRIPRHRCGRHRLMMCRHVVLLPPPRALAATGKYSTLGSAWRCSGRPRRFGTRPW